MSGADTSEDARTYSVVVNEEEQYSIWLADREVPAGWRAVGKTGPKTECLDFIDKAWTDMRPLSLRKWMEEEAARSERTSKNGGV
jgi:MbtH protein